MVSVSDFVENWQRLEIIDFAIEDERDGAIVIAHRLVAGRQVDDRQAPVEETDPERVIARGKNGCADPVRAPGFDGAPHRLKQDLRLGRSGRDD